MPEWTLTLNNKIIKNFNITAGEKLIIGRGSDADVVIDNTAVSRHHTAFELAGKNYFIEDLGSLNGTFVNGKKITERTMLQEDNIIQIGKFRLTPAGIFAQREAVSQSSAMDLDMDEETVFVTQKKQAVHQPTQANTHALTVISGSGQPRAITLSGRSSIKIGKDSNCDLVVKGWFIAGAQCYIINRDNKNFIVPQKSWVGTKLNNQKITEEKLLNKGDIIAIKNHQIRFE